MQITFSGTTDNSNFDYITNQTTDNYRVISPPPASNGTGVILRTKENQKVLFKDEVIITTRQGNGTSSPGITTTGTNRGEVTFDSCNILINPTQKMRRVTEGNIKFINSNILVLPEDGRINFTADRIEGMHLKVRRRSPSEQVFLYVNPNTVFRDYPENLICLKVCGVLSWQKVLN